MFEKNYLAILIETPSSQHNRLYLDGESLRPVLFDYHSRVGISPIAGMLTANGLRCRIISVQVSEVVQESASVEEYNPPEDVSKP